MTIPSFHHNLLCITSMNRGRYISPLITFSTINNISISVKRSNFTLVFSKAACRGNPGGEKNFA